MDQGSYLFETEEVPDSLNIEEEFKSLKSALDSLVSRIVYKTELLNKNQMRAAEIEDKIKFIEENFKDPEGSTIRRTQLNSIISEQKPKNLIINKENEQLSLKTSEIEQTVNNATAIIETMSDNTKPHELNENIQETKKNLENLNFLKNQENEKITKIRNLIQELETKIADSKEKNKNLTEIKENLIAKIQNTETNCEAIHEKIKIHQTEEQKLAEKLFIAKRETEEALLSFKKFKFRLSSLFKPEYSILITRKSSGLLILLQSSKQEIPITKDTHCSIAMSKMRPDHFYLTTDNITREFESKDAQKIVNFLNLAIKLSSEE